MKKPNPSIAALACLLSASLPAAAQTPSAGAWAFDAALYAYLPSVGGKTTFSPAGGGGGSDVAVDAAKLIENLNATFMGTFEARRGRWGAFTDVIYLDIGGSKSDTRDLSIGGAGIPASATASASLDLKGWLWTLGGAYRVESAPHATLDLLAGARMFDMTQKLGWQLGGNVGSIPAPGRGGAVETSLRNWDAIVGVKGRVGLGGGKWFLPYYADVGTGDSDLTWQAYAGVGYDFSWGSVVGAWRYVDYRMKSGSKIEDVNFNGPGIAAVFRW